MNDAQDQPGATGCELDPITWDALVSGMQAHGVAHDVIGKVCHDALRSINATPVAERDRRNAEAEANAAKRRAGQL
ncbi:hypothetical protein [Streptomyces sp. NBC_01304]|uniref:hypothetical protein n=1 Tax=Streptomyces sp. NBC_01304 TaxID=2903818 RepID=UPI002E11375F|nr:hypothetical protein OG430_06310 [Streptomyces sp. NBC_01304]